MRYQKAAPLLIIFGMIASLASCGFTPVYGPEAQVGQTLSNIRTASPNTRVEYLFVRNLEERIGHNPTGENTLTYDITVFEHGVNTLGATRSQVIGKVRYQLVSQDGEKVIATGFVETFTAYSLESQKLGATQRDATERLMQILADRTTTDLMIKLTQ